MTRLPPLLLFVAIGMLLPVALLFPAAVRADNHDHWELHLGFMPGPLAGHCGGELHARGIASPSDSIVALGRIDESGAFAEFQRITTSENGWFSELLTAPYPPDCAPGDTITISARVLDASGAAFPGAPGSALEVLTQFEIRTDQASISLRPATGPGCMGDTTTVSGDGYPPDASVSLSWGSVDPYILEFASLVVIPVDSEGKFEQEVDLLFGRCVEPGNAVAIFALVTEPNGHPIEGVPPRVSAIYTVGVPDPASAGNAGLLHDASPPRRLQLLLLAATIVLVTVGRATSPGAHQ
jgi:hypothetical protein